MHEYKYSSYSHPDYDYHIYVETEAVFCKRLWSMHFIIEIETVNNEIPDLTKFIHVRAYISFKTIFLYVKQFSLN